MLLGNSLNISRIYSDVGGFPDWVISGDVDFTQDPYPSEFEFSRASTGWAIDGNTLTTYAADQPRFTSGGLLIEPESTNIVQNNLEIANAGVLKSGWSISGGSANATPIASPITGYNATVIDFTTGGRYVQQSMAATVEEGAVYTARVWARAASGTVNDVDFYLMNNSSPYTVQSGFVNNADLTETWQELKFTFTKTTDGVTNLRLRVVSPTDNTSIAVWGFQVEKQPYATSLIVNDDSINTRAAESAKGGLEFGGTLTHTPNATGIEEVDSLPSGANFFNHGGTRYGTFALLDQVTSDTLLFYGNTNQLKFGDDAILFQ